jgi:hypothetical protein
MHLAINNKFLLIVLFVVAFSFTSCSAFGWRGAPSPSQVKKKARNVPTPRPEERAGYGPPTQLARIENRDVNESSGVAASRTNPGVFWTHNDSGDGPYIYTFDAQGKSRGVWRVKGAKSRDWEDMAQGPGPESGRSYLYIGDIGDNDYERQTITIYRVLEPIVSPDDAASTRSNARQTEAAEAIKLKYPDGAHDAETLIVHPSTGDIYIVTKSLDSAAGVYKLAAPFTSGDEPQTLARMGEVRAPATAFAGFFTGGAISPDGTRVVLCDYVNAYELVLPSDAPFNAVWKQPSLVIDLGEREQGEAITYTSDGESIVCTSEGRHASVVQVRRKG